MIYAFVFIVVAAIAYLSYIKKRKIKICNERISFKPTIEKKCNHKIIYKKGFGYRCKRCWKPKSQCHDS